MSKDKEMENGHTGIVEKKNNKQASSEKEQTSSWGFT